MAIENTEVPGRYHRHLSREIWLTTDGTMSDVRLVFARTFNPQLDPRIHSTTYSLDCPPRPATMGALTDFDRQYDTGSRTVDFEYRTFRKNGQYHWTAGIPFEKVAAALTKAEQGNHPKRPDGPVGWYA